MVYHDAVSFPCSSDCLRGWRALFGPNTGCRNEISMQLRIFCSIRFKTSLHCFLCYLHSKTRTSLHHLEFKKRIVCYVTKQQCRTRQRVQSYCGFTLCQRSVRTASPLPTTTRRTRCFQVGDYAKISVSTTKRRCRPG